MKLSNRELEQCIKHALEKDTPDLMQNILLRINDTQESGPSIEQPETNAIPFAQVAESAREKRRSHAAWIKWAGGVAAAFIIAAGGYMGYGHLAPQSSISFDVNPSIELKINRYEKVLSAEALNQDAEIIMDGMDLKNTDLDVAVNALVGSMLKNGYIDEIKNSILISVDSKNEQTAVRLQQKLLSEVNDMLSSQSFNGALLIQTVNGDEQLKQLSEQHHITVGKTALINSLLEQDQTLTFDSLAALSVNDLNLLLNAKQANPAGIQAQGQASNKAYIPEAQALAAALEHAGLTESELVKYEIELDFDDGMMVYEIDFRTSTAKYEYEIDATTGALVKYELENDHVRERPSSTSPTSGTSSAVSSGISSTTSSGAGGVEGHIGAEQATQIAVAHAGADASSLREYSCKLDREDGRMIYEIEFAYAGIEYEYEIDALSGDILKWESDDD